MREHALVAILCLASACEDDSASRTPTESSMTVHTEIDRLRRYLDVPIGHCTWVVRARGVQGGAPGPTDTELFAAVQLTPAGWAALGAPGAPDTLAVPEDVLRLILPRPPGQSSASVRGARYELAGKILNPYTGDFGVRVGDSLVVALYTR